MCGCKQKRAAEKPTLTVTEFKKTPQSDVVGVLKHMLELAEAGHIRAVAVVAQADRINTSSCYALGNGDIAHLVLACNRVISRLLQECEQ